MHLLMLDCLCMRVHRWAGQYIWFLLVHVTTAASGASGPATVMTVHMSPCHLVQKLYVYSPLPLACIPIGGIRNHVSKQLVAAEACTLHSKPRRYTITRCLLDAKSVGVAAKGNADTRWSFA